MAAANCPRGSAKMRRAQPQRVRGAEHDEPADQRRVERGGRPGDHAAEAGADHGRRPFAERADQPGDVGGEGVAVVPAGRLVAGAVAAQVDGDRPEAGVGDRRQHARARPTRTPGSRAGRAPSGRCRPPRRGSGCRWRRRSGASTAPRSGRRTRRRAGHAARSCAQPRARRCPARCRAALAAVVAPGAAQPTLANFTQPYVPARTAVDARRGSARPVPGCGCPRRGCQPVVAVERVRLAVVGDQAVAGAGAAPW